MKVASILFNVTMFSWLVGSQWLAETMESDICIYGGTSDGVIVAVQAAKIHKRFGLARVKSLHLEAFKARPLFNQISVNTPRL
ncbi:MAG TPA: hypothetical protein VL361_16050 [Candidatus Limnocylindrales bacterium]|nr:hypothetical protein [Candidatus Limnocylindrales bacterium]